MNYLFDCINLLHELSHAVIATGYGGFVAEIGIRKIKYGFKYYTRVFWGECAYK